MCPPGTPLSPKSARQILYEESGGMTISRDAAKLLDSFLKKYARRVAEEAGRQRDIEHRRIIKAKHVQAALVKIRKELQEEEAAKPRLRVA